MHRFTLRVRYADTDQMGWAYYGHYFRWFEIGRAEMLRSLGRQLPRGGGRPRAAPAGARCALPLPRGARYDDVVVIETGVAERSRVGVTFAYRVVPESDGAPATRSDARCTSSWIATAGPCGPVAEVEALLAKAPAADAS